MLKTLRLLASILNYLALSNHFLRKEEIEYNENSIRERKESRFVWGITPSYNQYYNRLISQVTFPSCCRFYLTMKNRNQTKGKVC